MSILIPGMEMPDRCFSCPMLDTDSCGISRGSYIEYREVDVDVAIDHRPDWCPLIPVPEHGDLIDRDEAAKKIWADMRFPSNLANAQFFVNELREMPTIIPADA